MVSAMGGQADANVNNLFFVMSSRGNLFQFEYLWKADTKLPWVCHFANAMRAFSKDTEQAKSFVKPVDRQLHPECVYLIGKNHQITSNVKAGFCGLRLWNAPITNQDVRYSS